VDEAQAKVLEQEVSSGVLLYLNNNDYDLYCLLPIMMNKTIL